MKAPETAPRETPPLRGIRVITFDAGGTLLRPHPSVGAVYREIALRHGIDRPAAALDRAFHEAFQHVSKDETVLDPEARERDFWWRVVRHTFLTTGEASASPAPRDAAADRLLRELFDELWIEFAHASRWRLFPDARATLQTLHTAGYKLAVLSNWDKRLHTVLEETGLRPLFDAVIISSEAGAEKPDIAIFRAAERALGCPPAACLHIGDSRRHDIEGATAAGWRSLLLRNDGAAPRPGEIGALG
ncbi:MAG: HAD family hydrolase, partial [Verrucomicrobia bacterium]